MPLLRHITLWLFGVMMLFLFIYPSFSKPESILARIEADQARLAGFFGEDEAKRIEAAAGRLYKAIVLPVAESLAGSYFLTDRDVKQAEDETKGGRTIAQFGHDYFKNALMAAYMFTTRAVVTVMILLFTLPFLVAAFLDGLTRLKVKRHEFDYIEPNIYHLSQHAIIAAVGFPAIYFISPIVPFEPLLFFFWAWALTLAISMAVANYPKSA